MGRGTASTNFKVHTTINLVCTLAIVLLLYAKVFVNCRFDLLLLWDYILNETWIQQGVFGVVFGTIWLNPDLDSDNSRTYKNWFIFRGYWYPYTKFMAHKGDSHNLLGLIDVKRGWGHNEFVGTGIRLILASPLSLTEFWFHLGSGWLIIIAGIWIADCLHILVDMLFHRNWI